MRDTQVPCAAFYQIFHPLRKTQSTSQNDRCNKGHFLVDTLFSDVCVKHGLHKGHIAGRNEKLPSVHVAI
jgi:hypothetical protein